MNFAIFRRNFDENFPEFHRNCQEMTKCTEILRKSATKIRKMLEVSGICEKISFFISFFHSCPYSPDVVGPAAGALHASACGSAAAVPGLAALLRG